jgi:hypothetical protein
LVKAAIPPVLLFLVAGVLAHWAWNTLAGDLLQAPELRFKHAVAAELLLAVAVAVGTTVNRLCRGSPTPVSAPRPQ